MSEPDKSCSSPCELRCTNLSFSVGQAVILDSINLTVGRGEMIVVSGPSGAGKTTLLRLIAGLERPTAGTIEIGGREVSSPRSVVPPRLRDVAMVFEQAALWPHLTVEQHVKIVLKAKGKRQKAKEQSWELLDRVGLLALRRRYPHQLSAGERHRVALARSLAQSPRLLLLDEPLAHLDVHLAADLARLLVDVHDRERLTTLCVMHRPECVNSAVSRYVILERGRIIQCGAAQDVFNAPQSEFVAALGHTLALSQTAPDLEDSSPRSRRDRT